MYTVYPIVTTPEYYGVENGYEAFLRTEKLEEALREVAEREGWTVEVRRVTERETFANRPLGDPTIIARLQEVERELDLVEIDVLEDEAEDEDDDEDDEFPARYRDTILDFLGEYLGRLSSELSSSYDAEVGELPEGEELLDTPLARRLGEIARAAEGRMSRESGALMALDEDVADLLRRLFGEETRRTIPESFWDTPLGTMVARALLWRWEGELITIQEAVELTGLTHQGLKNAIDRGGLAAYYNPDAPQRQGRVLVRRVEVGRKRKA